MLNLLNEVAIFTAAPDILRELFRHEASWLRDRVCESMHCPVDILASGSDDDSEVVRWAVAEHPNAPTYVLKYLLEDGDSDVEDSARENLRSRGIGQ